MSKKRKNFHYHYAEKFENTSRERKHRLFVTPIALVISLVLLVLFGLVSATFSIYVTDNLNDSDSVSDGSMLITVRDHKKRIDAGLDAPLHRNDLPLVQTGADADVAPLSVGDKGDLLILNTGNWGGTSPAFDACVSDGTNNAWLQFSPFYDNYFYTTLPTSFKATSMVLYRSSAHISSDSGYWNKTDSIDISTTSNSYWMDDYSYGHWADNMSFNLYSNHSSMNGKSLSYDGAGHLTAFGEKVLANSTSVEYKVSSSYGKWFGGDNNKTDPSYTNGYYYDITVSFDLSKATVSNHSDLTITKTRYNKVSRSAAPGNGSLYIGTTSNPSTTSADVLPGATYYIKAIPNTNYQIKTLTVGGQQVSLTDTQKAEGVNSSFTMASSDVTVSVEYEEKHTPHWATTAFNNVTKNVTDTSVFTVPGTILYPTSASGILSAVANVTSGNSVQTYGTPSISDSTASVPLKITDKTGTSTVRVELFDGSTSMGTTSFTVTVSEPSVSFTALSIEEYRSGTLSVSSSTPALQSSWTYSWNTTSTAITLGSGATITSQPVTAKAYAAATQPVTLTVTYPSGYQKTYSKSVTVTESTIKIKGTFGDVIGSDWDEHKMLYDSTASEYGHGDLYSITFTLNPNKKYTFGMMKGETFYKDGGDITSDTTGCYVDDTEAAGITLSTGGNNCTITTGYKGTYTFYYNPTTDKMFISRYPGVEYYLLGLGSSNWGLTPDRKMIETSPGSGIYTWTKTCVADETYDISQNIDDGFKIYINNDTYFGLQNTTFTQDNNSYELTNNDQGNSYNMGFAATYSGEYTFTFDATTYDLTVTYPSRSISSQAYFNNATVGDPATIGNPSDFASIEYIGHDQFTLSATTASGFAYTFQNWSDNNTTNPRTLTVTDSDPVTINSNWNYSSFDIDLYSEVPDITISGYTVDSSNAKHFIGGKYTYGTGATLPNPTGPDGYAFVGWYTNSDLTGSPVTVIDTDETDNKTFYAKWEIVITVKDNIYKNTLKTYTISVPGSIFPAKSDWSTADAEMENKGFTFSDFNDKTWTDLRVPKVITAIYIPKVYAFNVTFIPNTNVADKDGHTGSSMAADTGTDAAKPYVLGFGADISAEASFTVPNSLNGNIEYQWYIMNGSIEISVASTKTSSAGETTVKYTNKHISTMMTQPSVGGNGVPFTLFVKAKITVDGQTYNSSTNQQKTIYYKVNSPIDSLYLHPDQLIYSSAPDLAVQLTAHSSMTDEYAAKLINSYKTEPMYFDKDSGEFVSMGQAAITGTKPDFVSTVFSAAYAEQFGATASGVNYFKFKLKRPMGTTPETYETDSETSERQITVGSYGKQESRPLFVAPGTVQLTDYRVMLFYKNEQGLLDYQTSSLSSSYSAYRFEIPANVNSVCIAAFDKSAKYVLPKFENDTYIWADGNGFDTHVYAHSDNVSITSSTQKVTITALNEGVLTVE